jgi:hypothetical protein
MIPYKKLIVSGCSFTVDHSWAYFLAKKYDLELINLSHVAAGNKHIADSLIVYLEQTNFDINEVLIGIMWSGIGRRDWMVSLTDQQYHDPFAYKYADDVSRVVPNDLLRNLKIQPFSIKNDQELSLLEIAYNPGNQAARLQGLLSIIYLNSYLVSKGYKFFQTHFFDPDSDDNQSINMITTNYSNSYKKFNINRPSIGMLNFLPDQFLGNWAIKNNCTVSSKDIHPTEPGHELWAETVLIPKLSQQKLLTDG